MTEQNEAFFTVEDVASRYRVTKKTVTRWIDDGLLPGSIKKGPYPNSPYEVPQSALDHFDSLRQSNSVD